jgi:hypothetical protein
MGFYGRNKNQQNNFFVSGTHGKVSASRWRLHRMATSPDQPQKG